MPAGRPTKYNETLQAKADNYLYSYDSEIPSICGLCIELDIDKTTAYAWSKDETKPEFSHTFKLLSLLQEKKLLDSGLNGTFNAGICKLALANHGYHDKQDVNQNINVTKKAEDLTDDELAAIATAGRDNT